MSDVPHEVLSEHFQERIGGRRLVAAVFTAFQLDPGFFEQEILPVFFDVTLSHAPVMKLVQLDAPLRDLQGGVAVYYDANGLITGADGSAKLDVRRIPVRLSTGIFHPKTVFALVEEAETGDDGHRAQTLLVAALSANLTRSGWWENVEVCHVEELEEKAVTRLRTELLEFFATLRRRAPTGTDHTALEKIAAFVRRTEQRITRSVDGHLQSHFFAGDVAFDDFLGGVLGSNAKDFCLEVISPFFDGDDESTPLAKLIRRFRPCETRVFLPRNERGEALVRPEMYAWLHGLDNAAWGKFPKAMLRSGNSDEARPRFVHAKVYRFFSSSPRREILVVGSVNLTRSAHQVGGNLESALVVEVDPPRRPDFWLEPDATRPAAFGQPDRADDGDLAVADSGTRLSLRFQWDTHTLDAYWDAARPSPSLQVEANGVSLFEIATLPPRAWSPLPGEAAKTLEGVLASTSFVTIIRDRSEPVPLLVQEESMWKKPPLIGQLSVRDILRYWSLLTVEQRNDFLAVRASELIGDAALGDLVPRLRTIATVDTIFDRFAGTFHAFERVEATVDEALESGREKVALYRLFGTTYDSLRSLLRRVRDEPERDAVDSYVLVLCAKQLCRELKRRWPDFWSAHPVESAELEGDISIGDDLRRSLIARQPTEMEPFLDWFDRWFLDKARPIQAAP